MFVCLDYIFLIKCNKRQLFSRKNNAELRSRLFCLFIFQMYSSCIRLQLLFSPCRPHDLAVVNMCVSEVFLVGFLQILGSYRLCKGSKDSLLFRMLRDVEGFWNFFKKIFFFWYIRGKPTVRAQNTVPNYPICGVLLCFKAISCE